MSAGHTKAFIWLTAIGFVLTAIAGLSMFAYAFGPCIEPYVAGYIVRITQPDQIFRGYIRKKETGRKVEVASFRLHNLRKLAAGIPHKYSFEVEAQLSDRIPVSVYLCDPATHQRTGEDLATHKVGTVWDRTYCFEMPGTIGDDQAIRVSGHAEHTRLVFGNRFPFWYSVTPIPEFVVPPVP